ncbi:hypothetical protein ACLKA6_018992 [Drosophila palustris]
MTSKQRSKKKPCTEVEELKTTVECIRTELSVLADAVSTQTAYIKRLLKRNSKGSAKAKNPQTETADATETSIFPLQSENDLIRIDRKITPENQEKYINKIKNLLALGVLSTSIKKIMTEELILEHNMDGSCNKKSLQDYDTFFSVLLDAIQLMDSTKPARKQLQKALYCVKNNFNKNKSNKRKRDLKNFEIVYDSNSNDNSVDNKSEL